MTEQKFVYVDVNYLKELEETAKKVDYYKGIIDGIMMCREEPQTHDICTNTHECVKDTHDKTEPQICITEDRDTQVLDAWQVHHRNTTSAVEDEPQTEDEYLKNCPYNCDWDE